MEVNRGGTSVDRFYGEKPETTIMEQYVIHISYAAIRVVEISWLRMNHQNTKSKGSSILKMPRAGTVWSCFDSQRTPVVFWGRYRNMLLSLDGIFTSCRVDGRACSVVILPHLDKDREAGAKAPAWSRKDGLF